MNWTVVLQSDVVRGRWLESWRLWVYHEFFYLVARRGDEAYVHFRLIHDDWEKAHRLLEKVTTAENFTPEGKPELWFKVVDSRPFQPEKKVNYRNLLMRGLERYDLRRKVRAEEPEECAC